MSGSLRAICISEDEALADHIRQGLSFAYPQLHIQTVPTLVAMAGMPSPDLVIWDQAQQDRPLPLPLAGLPTILIRKQRSESTGAPSLCEICLRGEVMQSQFPALVRQLLERRRLSQALAEAEALWRDRHMRDPITNLYSKSAFHELFGQVIKTAARKKTPVTLVLIDLDNLRGVVSQHDIPEDGVIKQIAMLLQQTVREVDLLARLEEDLFAIGLSETGLEHAHILAERIQRAIHQARGVPVGDLPAPVPTVSIGISASALGQRSATQLFEMAERALRAAKKAGGNQTVAAGPKTHTVGIIAQESAASLQRVRDLRIQIAHHTHAIRQQYLKHLGKLFASNETYYALVAPHAERVTTYAVALAQVLGWREADREVLARAALLHDLGLSTFSPALLAAPAIYSTEERELIQQHPILAVQLLDATPFLRPELAMILHHHEWFDGNGYPDRIAGNNIPAGARIIAIAEAWDRMIEAQPYREALTSDLAAHQLREAAGTQFDPEMVAAFLPLWAEKQRSGN